MQVACLFAGYIRFASPRGHEACCFGAIHQPLSSTRAAMKTSTLFTSTLAVALLASLTPYRASADDSPSPCSSLKRIVAAAPDGFTALSPDDGKGVAQPYGDDAQCSAARGSYQCMWTPHRDAGSSADALQAVAADIASCLPDATHDQNSPGRQHFYLGAPARRTQITLTSAGSGKLRLSVSGK